MQKKNVILEQNYAKMLSKADSNKYAVFFSRKLKYESNFYLQITKKFIKTLVLIHIYVYQIYFEVLVFDELSNVSKIEFRWISDRNRNTNKQAYYIYIA